jgi:molecular chaperone GrpE
VANDPEKPDPGSGGGSPDGGEGFDAIKAAEELAASLGMAGEAQVEGAAEESYAVTLEKEIEQLNLLLDQKDVEVAQARTAAARAVEARDAAQAEISKASARIERELEKRSQLEYRNMLLAFIEINDDLDRAIDAASTSEAAETVLEGVELVSRAFDRKLAEFGVARIEAMGQPFDPNAHEAITQMAVDDPAKDMTVVGVILVGYRIGEELLRPAKVAVGKYAP